MATRIDSCRICGKTFTPCNKTSAALGAFNYREIACSPECGKQYFKRVLESRTGATTEIADVDTFVKVPIVESTKPAVKKRAKKATNKTEEETEGS